MGTRILIAVDGSSFSEAATRVAIQLAQTVPGATLHALHVVNVVAPSGNVLKDLKGRLGFEPAVVDPAIGRQHEEKGRQLLQGLERDAELAGVTVESTLEHGAVAERLIHHARHADLVVMGLRGDTEDRFPGQGGSSIEAVLQSVTVPVIFVPRGGERIERIAVGYDASEAASHAISAIRRIFAGTAVEVHAIHVGDAEEGEKLLGEVDAALPTQDVVHHVVGGDQVHVALAAEADRVGAQALAMGFRGQASLKSFLYGSATSYILGNTRLAVLVAH